MSTIDIRTATEADCALILKFISELASFENALEEVVASEEDLRQALFGDNPKVFALICSVDGLPAGCAVYFLSFSTWTGKHSLFLEDLYVSPDNRGSGAGKALLKHLAKLAVEKDCRRFEWNVLDWNTSAIDFYESFGALPQNEWVGYRLSGQALEHFADSD